MKEIKDITVCRKCGKEYSFNCFLYEPGTPAIIGDVPKNIVSLPFFDKDDVVVKTQCPNCKSQNKVINPRTL